MAKKQRFKKETDYNWEGFRGCSMISLFCLGVVAYYVAWLSEPLTMSWVHIMVAAIVFICLLFMKFAAKTEYVEI